MSTSVWRNPTTVMSWLFVQTQLEITSVPVNLVILGVALRTIVSVQYINHYLNYSRILRRPIAPLFRLVPRPEKIDQSTVDQSFRRFQLRCGSITGTIAHSNRTSFDMTRVNFASTA